jgi:WD40 repeat protein
MPKPLSFLQNRHITWKLIFAGAIVAISAFLLHQLHPREVVTTIQHDRRIITGWYSPDRRYIVTVGKCHIYVLDGANGNSIVTHRICERNRDHKITGGIVISPDNTLLAITYHESSLRYAYIYSLKTGESINEFLISNSDSCPPSYPMTFDRTGNLITFGMGRQMKTYIVGTGTQTASIQGHADSIMDVIYSPDNRFAASASADDTIKIWDAGTWQEMMTLTGHTSDIVAIAYNSDGSRLASIGRDRTGRVWNPHTGEEILSFEVISGWGNSISFSHDDQYLLSTEDWSYEATIRDAATGDTIKTIHMGIYSRTPHYVYASFGSNGDDFIIIGDGILNMIDPKIAP